MIELDLLQTNNLIDVMNKMKAMEFLRLRKTCKAMNNFADQHQSIIGVSVDSRIEFHYRDKIEVSVTGSFKRYSLSEATRKFSGFSFNFATFKLGFDHSAEEIQLLLEFLRARLWRQVCLTLDDIRPDILEIIRPYRLVSSLPNTALENNAYVDWCNRITSISEIRKLAFGIKDYRGPKILELVLQKWSVDDLGSLIFVVPGINFTFCNVEEFPVEEMIKTIERRHMKTIFETLDKFGDVERRHGGYEVYEENLLPEERFTENVEWTYKPVGIIKIHTKKREQEGCLAVEISQYSDRNFNVSFCFYTKKNAVEEYEMRMRELLGRSSTELAG